MLPSTSCKLQVTKISLLLEQFWFLSYIEEEREYYFIFQMPSDVSAITVKKIGALKHDKEGFVTPMKVKPLNQLIKVSFDVGQISLIVVISNLIIQDLN